MLHRRAAESFDVLVGKVVAADIARPTPCSGWTIRDLLEHEVAQKRGFAHAASGQRSDLAMWQRRPLDDPVARHAEATGRLLAAFAAEGVLDRKFRLPELRDGGPFPASTAIGFQFVDCVVHEWDIAAASGVPPTVDTDLAEAALPLAGAVPDGPDLRGPGRAFHPGVPASPGMSALDRVVALLGRDPERGVRPARITWWTGSRGQVDRAVQAFAEVRRRGVEQLVSELEQRASGGDLVADLRHLGIGRMPARRAVAV